MPYFALFYDTVDNFVERRQPHRAAHLAQADAAHRDGSLLLAGALKPSGALLVFRAEDARAAERFAEADPYVRNGLVTGWRVHEWAVVIGDGTMTRSPEGVR
jgi:uncharacterized protein YciI